MSGITMGLFKYMGDLLNIYNNISINENYIKVTVILSPSPINLCCIVQ